MSANSTLNLEYDIFLNVSKYQPLFTMLTFNIIVLNFILKFQLCGCKFVANSVLVHHIKVVHEKIKDYECQLCSKRFGSSGHLKRHLANVHGARKDFQCQACGKTFAQISALNTHINHVHGENQ